MQEENITNQNQDLYGELASRVKSSESTIIPKLFRILADEIDAKILLALPGNISDLSGQLGLEPADVEARLEGLFQKGVVFRNKKKSPVVYKMAKDAMHLHDCSMQWQDGGEAFRDLWRQWGEEEWPAISELERGKKPITRLLAADIWIDSPKDKILPFDSIREIITQARSLAVMPCACRIKYGGKCGHRMEGCIVLNGSADYNIERGTARKIDATEALDIIEKCEEDGLLHLTGANSQSDPGPIICNCCPCCCIALPLILRDQCWVDPSRFCAQIDQEKCYGNGCLICQERCYFDAIKTAEDGKATVIKEKCTGCGLCKRKCPADAITWIEEREPDFVPKVNSAKLY